MSRFRACVPAGRAGKIIINDIVVPPYGVFAKPGMKRFADLKGQAVSIGRGKDVTSSI